MNIRMFTIGATIPTIAAVMMALTFPFSGAMSGALSVGLDSLFGPEWEMIPLMSLAPLLIAYLSYCLAVSIIIWFFFRLADDKTVYPPVDEEGRPMTASFSSHGGGFRLLRRHHRP